MEGKMKMVSFVTILLTSVAVTTTVSCTDDDKSIRPNSEVGESLDSVEATTQNDSLMPALNDREKKVQSTKYDFRNTKWVGRAQKPFLYGKKFELQKEFNVNRYDLEGTKNQGGLVSPLITSPIRPLPYIAEKKTFNKNQSNILKSVRESMNANSNGIFNKTYFMKYPSGLDNHGKNAKNLSHIQNSAEELNPTFRQNYDRSLMVVLPFNPVSNGSVEEFFTKKPVVKLEETSADIQSNEEKNTGNITPLMREKVVDTTTEFDRKSFLTRRPWRPSKRSRVTTEAYLTTTENGEDATKTYTNYNDVEQVTKKFSNFEYQKPSEQVSNHKYEVDIVTSSPNMLRSKNRIPVADVRTEVDVDGIGSIAETTLKNLDDIAIEDEKIIKYSKWKQKNSRNKTMVDVPNQEDITKVLEILPNKMKDVIVQLGLNNDNLESFPDESNKKKIFDLKRVSQPTIDPKSYSVFKPIEFEIKDETKHAVSDDMKTFLASFGLLPVSRRDQKSLKTDQPMQTEKITESKLNFLPDDLKLVLDDMGLMKYGKKDSMTIHIFNPINHTVAKSDEDLKKLNAILRSIKKTVNESKSFAPEMQSEIIHKIKELNNLRYKSGNLTEINNEIKKIIVSKFPKESKNKNTKRATKLPDGPDPLIFAEENIFRNDVKRQDTDMSKSSSSVSGVSSNFSAVPSSTSSNDEAGSTTSSSLSESDSSNDSTTTTTEEGPNIEALRESFGGGETASDTEDVDSALPPKRPNGLYLLLDWNSFLEVGTEDDRRRVNLRFQPKIGDSRNFLPIRVP